MDLNKTGAFIAHMAGCGLLIGSAIVGRADFLQIAILAELMAIYFNT